MRAGGGSLHDVGAHAVPVEDASQVGEARRAALGVAESLRLDERTRGEAAIIATELATNLAIHARGGVLLVQPVGGVGGATPGIEIVSVDAGPGMADPERCLQDGYSTAGTPGNGLGAVRRLAHAFSLHSHVGRGTVLVAALWADRAAASQERARVDDMLGAVALPKPGESLCGDAWAAAADDSGRVALLVADGLGHGPLAAEASAAAGRVFLEHAATASPAGMVELMHDVLRGTRGAAVGVAVVDAAAGEVRFAGIGNIAGAVARTGEQRYMVSHNGIVGHQMHKVQEFRYPAPPGALVALASDGLRTQWRLDGDTGGASPTAIAAMLWREYSRGRDDATALVLRVAAPGAAGGT